MHILQHVYNSIHSICNHQSPKVTTCIVNLFASFLITKHYRVDYTALVSMQMPFHIFVVHLVRDFNQWNMEESIAGEQSHHFKNVVLVVALYALFQICFLVITEIMLELSVFHGHQVIIASNS